MFCTGCGTQAIGGDPFCGGCGKDAPARGAVFHVGQAIQRQAMPDGVKGWSWGAFLLNWIWAVGNNTWIGLLAFVPIVNVPVMFWLGFKGRELAWRNRHWRSLDEFNRVQRLWSQWAVGIALAYAAMVFLFTLIVVLASLNQPRVDADDTVVQQEDVSARRIGS